MEYFWTCSEKKKNHLRAPLSLLQQDCELNIFGLGKKIPHFSPFYDMVIVSIINRRWRRSFTPYTMPSPNGWIWSRPLVIGFLRTAQNSLFTLLTSAFFFIFVPACLCFETVRIGLLFFTKSNQTINDSGTLHIYCFRPLILHPSLWHTHTEGGCSLCYRTVGRH